jgi:hypothetical protein
MAFMFSCLSPLHKMKIGVLLALLLVCLSPSPPCLAADKDTIQPSVYKQPGFWDGEFTDGSSGWQYGHPDPGSSEGKTGQKNKDYPQHFWIPPLRQFEDTDPEELEEQEGHSYSPYALLLLPVDVKYKDWKLPKGYYQVKLGQNNDGSPKTRLAPQDQRPFTPSLANLKTPTYKPPTKMEQLKAKTPWLGRSKTAVNTEEVLDLPPLLVPDPTVSKPPTPSKDSFAEQSLQQRFVSTLVIKKLGKVVAVLPVLEKKAAPAQKASRWRFERKFDHPVAWVATSPQGLWLYVSDGRTVFASELDTVNAP